MKTIALNEKTFELLEGLKRKKKAASYDELVIDLIMEKGNIPYSMRGSLKGKAKPFTSAERRKIWKDANRRWQ